jgi:hypothetical protein
VTHNVIHILCLWLCRRGAHVERLHRRLRFPPLVLGYAPLLDLQHRILQLACGERRRGAVYPLLMYDPPSANCGVSNGQARRYALTSTMTSPCGILPVAAAMVVVDDHLASCTDRCDETKVNRYQDLTWSARQSREPRHLRLHDEAHHLTPACRRSSIAMSAQSPLISIPRKTTTDVDWTNPIRSIIGQSYGEDPKNYAEECSVLQRCRQDAVKGAGSDQTGAYGRCIRGHQADGSSRLAVQILRPARAA